MTIQEQIAELRRLHAGATPGDWSVRMGHRGARVTLFLHRGPDSDGDSLNGAGNDIEFIAAAHNAIPGLLDHLEVVERERDELREIYRAQNMAGWLSDRDARLKREGAAEAYERAAEMLSVLPGGTDAEEMMRDAAKRLREGK